MPGRDIRFRVPPGEANWGAATLLRAASIATTVVPEPPSPYLAGRRSWQPKGTSISLEAQAANQHASCYVGDARAASGSDHSAADPPDEQAQPCSAWPSQSAHAASHSPPDVHRSSPDTAAGANGLAATSRPAEPQAAQATPGMGTPEAILLDLQQASGQKSVWSRDPTARSGNAPLPEEQGPVAVGTVLQQREPQQHGTLDGAPKRRAAASAAQIERKFGKLLEEAEQLLARSNAARVVPKPAENAPAQRAEQPASKRMAFSRLDGRKNASFKVRMPGELVEKLRTYQENDVQRIQLERQCVQLSQQRQVARRAKRADEERSGPNHMLLNILALSSWSSAASGQREWAAGSEQQPRGGLHGGQCGSRMPPGDITWAGRRQGSLGQTDGDGINGKQYGSMTINAGEATHRGHHRGSYISRNGSGQLTRPMTAPCTLTGTLQAQPLNNQPVDQPADDGSGATSSTPVPPLQLWLVDRIRPGASAGPQTAARPAEHRGETSPDAPNVPSPSGVETLPDAHIPATSTPTRSYHHSHSRPATPPSHLVAAAATYRWARPGSGGSPTRRRDFLAPLECIRDQQRAHEQGVRLRKQQQHEEWERQLSVRTGYWREGSGASPAELEAARLERQRRLWANTVALASRLEVLRQGVIQHRRAKHEWRVRKDAALRIASWYARVKLREYNKRMFKLTSVLKTYVVPWIRRARHETRLRSGAMILDFLQALHGRNSAVAAVNAFMGRVTRIQRMWRSILVIRQHQRLLLGLQLHRHEGQLLREKRRQASEFAGIGGSAATPKSGLHRRGSLTGAPDLPTRHNNRQSTPGSPESPARPNNRQSLAGSVESPARTTASPPLSPKPSASVQQLAWLAGGSSPASPRAGAARSGGLRSERELLARMTHRLPREAKAEAVSHAVQQACLAFGRALDAYHQHLRLYAAQKPIEEARLIVLQQAGMAKGHSELRPPQRPRMVVLLGRDALTALLMQCYNAIDARESARLLEEAQQREEERVVEAWASGRRPKLA